MSKAVLRLMLVPGLILLSAGGLLSAAPHAPPGRPAGGRPFT